MEILYGFPAPLPFGIDFVVYSNEDLGRTNPFAAGTDTFNLALPYPSSMNLWEETMMLFCIEFIRHTGPRAVNAIVELGGEIVHLSMLDDDFGANWAGLLSDADDEAFKAKFAGPMYFGIAQANITATASVEGTERHFDIYYTAKYFPPEPLDLVTPLFINWTNAMANITLAENAITQDDDADITEEIATRVWFIKRDYSRLELAFLQRLPTRFQQLDS